jgi:hypothetical protein
LATRPSCRCSTFRPYQTSRNANRKARLRGSAYAARARNSLACGWPTHEKGGEPRLRSAASQYPSGRKHRVLESNGLTLDNLWRGCIFHPHVRLRKQTASRVGSGIASLPGSQRTLSRTGRAFRKVAILLERSSGRILLDLRWVHPAPKNDTE